MNDNDNPITFNTTFAVLGRSMLASLDLNFVLGRRRTGSGVALGMCGVGAGGGSRVKTAVIAGSMLENGNKRRVICGLPRAGLTPNGCVFRMGRRDTIGVKLMYSRSGSKLVTTSGGKFVDRLPNCNTPCVHPGFKGGTPANVGGGAAVGTRLSLCPGPTDRRVGVGAGKDRVGGVTVRGLLKRAMLATANGRASRRDVGVGALDSKACLIMVTASTGARAIGLVMG